MDMRYLRYVTPGEKYYQPPQKKADESALKVSTVPNSWRKKADDHWTYYFPSNIILPIQGWKIHVTTNSDEAQRTLELVSNFLFSESIPFKHVSNLWELVLKNSKYGDRGSSGKFITVYPKDEEQFIFLLNQLHRILKDIPQGPYILSDKRWLDGNVYFRYGAFGEMYVHEGAAKIPAIRTPNGEYIPDSRGAYYVVPDFIQEPKVIREMTEAQEKIQAERSQLDNYDIESALHFSNGGGVYLANHKGTNKQFVLKEGRPGSGLDGQNRDAVARLKQEALILKRLNGLDCVAKYKEIFQAWEHTFLVEEYLPGTTLNTWLAAYFPFSDEQDSASYCKTVINILKQLKQAVKDIHSRGIGMGDLQPSNIIISESEDVKIIDFESASDLTDAKHSGLMTPGFTGSAKSTREQADWFALLRIARHAFLPIGPVQDLAECILNQHDKWIARQFGQEAIDVINEIQDECKRRNVKPMDSVLSAPSNYLEKSDLPTIILKIRDGIVHDLSEKKRLLPGDIRQFETSNGLLNILTGGFGVIMALSRTGDLPDKAKEWAREFGQKEYIEQLDDGLFSGKAGIAGVLYEIGMKTEAKDIYDSIQSHLVSEDISLSTGLAGIGLAFLSASTLPDFEYLFDKSLAIAYRLEDLLARDIKIRPSDFDAIPIGLIDGWSGVSLFFSALYNVTSDKQWLTLSTLAINKDMEQCVLEESGLYQVKDASRFVPYLAGGSAGIGLAMIELRNLLHEKKWERELSGIGLLTKSKCFYSSGLFRGLTGLIVTANAIDIEFNLQGKENHIDKSLETLNLYLLEDEGRFYVPGDYSYRISGDIFSGSAGMLLALQDIKAKRMYSWLPLPEIAKIIPSLNNQKLSVFT
ncbi:class III lanthionine synthetase LanKC [Priestia megaterium]|uniref:class III lanthionine synthetase LanKC n=1 Tax=Priestia megaterium TaxID=1404 RepID=UPI0023DC7A86|nr:class III lanthionine synthetase LanKC [Priestia megaterium]MDF2013893.1 class III lanthionine synthetase LanKC [Priestia megaterium]